MIDSGIITAIVQLGYLTQRNVGPITISVQAKLDKFKDALKAINEEIAKFDSPDYFTDQELEYAKTLLDVNEIYDREKPSQYAHGQFLVGQFRAGLLHHLRRKPPQGHARRHQTVRAQVHEEQTAHRLRAALGRDQKRITLTEKDLLGRADPVGAADDGSAAKTKAAKTPQSKAPEAGANRTSTSRTAGSGKVMGNKNLNAATRSAATRVWRQSGEQETLGH